ncbi:MAG TPA: biopolymer transporter ExbD [Fibrobacteraceae bacterium]|nr:biopolymer transporter ExbD [Fibrobacteraceae bacterium]
MSSLVKRKRDNRPIEINVVNLIDVMLVLLIFFVTTSTFNRETGVDVTKPHASTARDLSRESILIGITREGAVHVNQTQVNMPSLRTILRQLIAESPDRPVIIVADRDAPSGRIVDVLDECNAAKVTKVSLSADKDKE